VKDDVLRRESIDPEKIHIVHNGVDIHEFKPAERFHPDLLAQRRVLGIPETAPVIGMIANFFPYKGHHEFVIAASEVHRRDPQVRFLCVGNDWGLQHQIEQLCQKLGLAESLIFARENQNISNMIDLIDIQVSASYEEGFSNVLLEGMASGKPIIATSVGGTPEAVLHNETGLLIPPKDPAALSRAILSLIHKPEFAIMLGENGRKRVEKHFSMEKMIDKLENLYLKLDDFS
jgi:glycosyltransferase involved in cell wall biosynthesis